MQRIDHLLDGCFAIGLPVFQDHRGSFVKTYTASLFGGEVPVTPCDFREEFYSISNKNVIRGMHFQLPPHDHTKLVYCPVGCVRDVLLDLRGGSDYGRTASIVLNASEPVLLVIPKGVAHGFVSLTDASLMVYKTSTEYAPTHDAGIRWDSFGFDWQCSAPLVSERDAAHGSLSSFASPF